MVMNPHDNRDLDYDLQTVRKLINIRRDQMTKFVSEQSVRLQNNLTTPANEAIVQEAVNMIYTSEGHAAVRAIKTNSPLQLTMFATALLVKLTAPTSSYLGLDDVDFNLLCESEDLSFSKDFQDYISHTANHIANDAATTIDMQHLVQNLTRILNFGVLDSMESELKLKLLLKTSYEGVKDTLGNSFEYPCPEKDIYKNMRLMYRAFNIVSTVESVGRLPAIKYCISKSSNAFYRNSLKAVGALLEHTSGFIALPRVFLYSEKPIRISLVKRHANDWDQDMEFHNANGMVIQFSDGSGAYASHGIPMKAIYMKAPEKLDTSLLFTETNVDVRRELLRRIGVSRLLEHGKVIEEKGDYKLIDMAPLLNKIRTEGVIDDDNFNRNRRGGRAPRRVNDILYAPYLYMKNPSVEGAFHLEGVSPECRTVQDAINWRADSHWINWEPYMLS